MATISLKKIMHPMRVFFLSLVVCGTTFQSLKAQQSEGWAAGEIVLEYVSGDCTDPTNDVLYDVVLKFYRDDIGATGAPMPDDVPVFIFSPDNGIPITGAVLHIVDKIPNSERSVDQYCLNGNKDATEGAWYRSRNSFSVGADQLGNWFFAFQGRYGGNYRSAADRNIALGQNFYIETILNFNCGEVEGTVFDPIGNTNKDTIVYNPPPEFSPTDYVFEDPVASFCVGQTYEWNMKAIRGNNVDRVEFDFAPILTFRSQLANYFASENFSIKSPFPVTGLIDDSDLESRGILRFTADRPFTGPVPFYVKNFREVWRIQDGSPVLRLERGREQALLTQREYRFIFDTNCNSRLPDFEGGVMVPEAGNPIGVFQNTFNASEGAYEYDCATTEFTLRLSEPVLSESLGLIGVPYENQDQGFRLASWNGNTSPDIQNNPFLDDVPVESVDTIRIVNVDETDLLRVTLARSIGPGKYTLYMKKGDDLNTLVNRCESTIPEFDSLTTIYVNSDFTYEHPKDNYSYCFPAGEPPVARIDVDPQLNPNYYVGWQYYGGQRFFPPGVGPNQNPDSIFFDTTYLGPRTFRLDDPEDSNWVNRIGIGAGWWKVGLGLDFSTFDPQTGQLIESRICYDEDEFFLDTVTVDSVFIPDFDLCPDEDLPVIDLSAFSDDIIASTFQWGKWDTDFEDGDPDTEIGKRVFLDELGVDSVDRKYDRISTTPYIFDTRSAFTGVGDTNHFRALFNMRGKFVKNRTCPVQIPFKVLKQLVLGRIDPRDSSICVNEEYAIFNSDSASYFKPEQYTWQWFFEADSLEGDRYSSFVQGTGWHSFEVIKTTQDTFCINHDSIYVEIAPEIDSVRPTCSEVTFNNGNVEQVFTWDGVPSADSYEVREIRNAADFDDPRNGPWIPANQPSGFAHRAIGRQIALQVRASNDDVDENAICRYGDTAFAEPCEAIVKPTNVFTPNGDGINDFLKFDLVEIYPGTKLIIFNRWGNKIYEDDDYFNDWDGENYQEGTYFYVLEINDPDDIQGLMKGTFTIIRD